MIITDNTPIVGAFKKIGWATLISVIGGILISVLNIYNMASVKTLSQLSSAMDNAMFLTLISALIGIGCQILIYSGYKTAQMVAPATPAGRAFGVMKGLTIGLIAIQAISLIPTIAESYKLMSTIGLISAVYSIVVLFMFRSKASTLYQTTNIESFYTVYQALNIGVWAFFIMIGALILYILAIILKASPEAAVIIFVLALLAAVVLAIIALVKWISGWLTVASEASYKEVEFED